MTRTGWGAQVEELVAKLWGRDDQQAAVLTVMADTERNLELLGWDQAPWLHLIYRSLPPPEVAEQMAAEGLRGQLMKVVPLTQLGGDGGQIAALLVRLARGLTRYLERHSPPDCHEVLAWMLTNEAWMASARPGDETSRAQLERDADQQRISARPDRVEARILLAVDRAGIVYVLSRRRGQQPAAMVDDGSGRCSFEGRLTDGLRALMEATPP